MLNKNFKILQIDNDLYDKISFAGFDLSPYVLEPVKKNKKQNLKIKDIKWENMSEETKKAINDTNKKIKQNKIKAYNTVQELIESL